MIADTVMGRVGAGRTFGTVPLDELFTLGIERDNDRDLWLRGTVGTRDGRKGSAPMGREYAIAQTDFSRRLFEAPLVKAYLGPFFDIGAVGTCPPLWLTRRLIRHRYTGDRSDTWIGESHARLWP